MSTLTENLRDPDVMRRWWDQLALDAADELDRKDAEIAELRRLLRGYQAFEASVDDALNQGTGAYRP